MPAAFTLATIPFAAREPLGLLGFAAGREAADLDYAGFGHALVPRIELVADATDADAGQGSSARPRTIVLRPRILALHAADDAARLADDIELEFWIDDETALVALLSRFLAVRGPALCAGADALVLAVCNPQRARLTRPPAIDLPIHYALGDVVAHLDADHPGPWSIDAVTLRLHADRWLTL